MAAIAPNFSPPRFANVEVSAIHPPSLLQDALKTERTLFMVGGFLYHARLETRISELAKRQLDDIIIRSKSLIVKNAAELEYANVIAPPHVPFFVIDNVNPIEHGKMVNLASSFFNGRVVHFPDVLPPSPPRPPQHNQ